MGYLDELIEESKKSSADEDIFKELEEEEKKEEEQEEEQEDTSKLILVKEYGRVKIYRSPDESILLYHIPVPKMTASERAILATVKEAATRLITISPEEIKDPEARWNFYFKKIKEIIKAAPELGVPASKIDFYAEWVTHEMIGYGALDLILEDDNLEEVMVIGPGKPVYVFHREYDMMKTNLVFKTDDDIYAIIDKIARFIGRRIDIQNPLLDATLPDGSRVNATIKPISPDGATLTIRKFRQVPFTAVDLIKKGTFSTELAAFLWMAVDGLMAKPANILVSGGTGSGKTTTLNVLASFIPERERVITVEDTPELKLPIEHWVRLLTRPPGLEGTGEITMDILVKNTLRMRPDRIIVGEVRHAEAFTLFTAMNTGHDGCMGTVHANSAQETIVRIMNPPMNVPVIMVSALDLIVVQARIHDRRKGTIRRVIEVAEVEGVIEGKPQLQTLYEWDAYTDTIKSTGMPSKYLMELQKYTGMSKREIEKELERRKDFLEGLVAKDINNLDELKKEIIEYYRQEQPEEEPLSE